MELLSRRCSGSRSLQVTGARRPPLGVAHSPQHVLAAACTLWSWEVDSVGVCTFCGGG